MPVEDGRTGATPRDGFRAARLMLEWLFHTSSTTPLACQQVARLPGRVRRQRLLGDNVSFIALRGFRSTVVVPSRLTAKGEPADLINVETGMARGASPHRGPCRAGSCCSSPARSPQGLRHDDEPTRVPQV